LDTLLYIETFSDYSFEGGSLIPKGVSYVPFSCSVYSSGFWIGLSKNDTPENAWNFSFAYACETDATIINAGFYGNVAKRGGAIYLDQQTNLETNQLTISQNTAQEGSAIYCNYGNWENMNNSLIWSNDPGSNIHCGANCNGPPCECACSFCEYCALEYQEIRLPDNTTFIDSSPKCHREFCTTPPECSAVYRVPQINNGNCDPAWNTLASCYDGGDCCNSTCNANTILYANVARQTCGSNGYYCLDPTAVETLQDLPCKAVPLPNQIGNGVCDLSNNVEKCWDGGDCCNSTCFGICSSFNCTDPAQLITPGKGAITSTGPSNEGFPLWGIIVAAVCGFVVLAVIIALVVYFVVFKETGEIV